MSCRVFPNGKIHQHVIRLRRGAETSEAKGGGGTAYQKFLRLLTRFILLMGVASFKQPGPVEVRAQTPLKNGQRKC